MKSRREFLLQTTLAVGSLAFLKPIKSIAFSPASPSPISGKLTVLNFNSVHRSLNTKFPGFHSSFAHSLPESFKKENNLLLLATGSNLGKENISKAQHLEKATWLKSIGFDAVQGYKHDLENKDLTYVSTDDDLLPFDIVVKQSIKVGIIGNNIMHDDALTNTGVKEIARKLNRTAAFLKANYNCNYIVSMDPCNSNGKECYKSKEKELAAITRNVDIIVSNISLKKPVTFIVKNDLKTDVILNYQGIEGAALKGIDISFNRKMEKTSFRLLRVV